MITYPLLVVNAGNVTLTNVSVSDPLAAPVTCPDTTLAPGGSTVCTANYLVTQADVDAGVIVNTATATGTPPTGPDVTDEDTHTEPITQTAAITLAKDTSDTLDFVGQTLSYSFIVTNAGNVTLTDVSLTDPLIAGVSCPDTVLGPGQSTTCVGSYTVTQADIDAGQVVNTATVTADDPNAQPVSDTDTETTVGNQVPAITIDKGAPVGPLDAGSTVTYFFDVTNVGNVTLTNVVVGDSITGPVTCNTTTLAPGDSTTCSADYTVTQSDVDTGQITNTADVTA